MVSVPLQIKSIHTENWAGKFELFFGGFDFLLTLSFLHLGIIVFEGEEIGDCEEGLLKGVC